MPANWLFPALYTVFPSLVALYAAALLLTRRSIHARTAWILAILIAFALAAGATWVMHDATARSNVPESFGALMRAYATLYLGPSIVLTALALWLRSRTQPRAGPRVAAVALLVAAALAINFVALRESGRFFEIVHAEG